MSIMFLVKAFIRHSLVSLDPLTWFHLISQVQRRLFHPQLSLIATPSFVSTQNSVSHGALVVRLSLQAVTLLLNVLLAHHNVCTEHYMMCTLTRTA